MAEGPHGAILQRDKTTYAIVPRTPVGLVTADILENMVQVVRKYNIPIIKITSGQRMALVGIKEEDLEPVWKDLGMEKGKALEMCVHYVQACPGTAVCKFGVQDSLGLGIQLEKLFVGMDLPAKLKLGISGCPFCCGESYVRDIGMFGKKGGWTFIIGGNAAGNPRVGDILADGLSDEEAIDLTRRALEHYRDNARKRERMGAYVERVGLEVLRDALL
jgi:NAD(P)H-nitrite reductase large subunit